MSIKLSGISVYPIKSVKGIPRDSAVVGEKGLVGDRMLMVTDDSGGFLTQRDIPALSLIEASVSDASLKLAAPGAGSVIVPIEGGPTLKPVEVWRDRCEAQDLGPGAADWISSFLGAECRIVRMPDEGTRPLDPKYGGGKVSFADAFPVLLIGESSLEELNSRLKEKLPMNRFRPNLVVIGSAPFEEDRWKRIRIGECEFRVVKPCARCVVTTIDQTSGNKTGKEPLKTLANFRQAKDVLPEAFESYGLDPNVVLFGQNLIPVTLGASIEIGDVVEVLE
ncbi:MAG TPA: MOSC N-terminal beta barrel domain-containing protein [Aridibacter sp.]|nr:MOSC N-terminal beta barrel domain-containing protein [Aridibacter sp.]